LIKGNERDQTNIVNITAAAAAAAPALRADAGSPSARSIVLYWLMGWLHTILTNGRLRRGTECVEIPLDYRADADR
jgi:hypothetical protein